MKTKSMKVLETIKEKRAGASGCAHTEIAHLPKISMEGIWLDKIGFHIGDMIQVSGKGGVLCISHVGKEMQDIMKVCEAGVESAGGMETAGSLPLEKIKEIKVRYSARMNKGSMGDGHMYAESRPKICMEGHWLEKLGFHAGERLQVAYGDGCIRICHAEAEKRVLAGMPSKDTGAYPDAKGKGHARLVLDMGMLRQYFPPDYTRMQMKEAVYSLLENWKVMQI